MLNYVSQGGIDPDALTTLAGRLARLQREFTPAQLDELKELAGGKSFSALARELLQACDPDRQIETAKRIFSEPGRPSDAQIRKAAEQLTQEAVTPFLKAAFRRRILEIRQQNEQVIDRYTIDAALYWGVRRIGGGKGEGQGTGLQSLDRGANAFTPEQREWLDRMAEHIATSLAIEPGDFEAGWFGQHGSLGKAHALFREQLQPLMRELNEKLAVRAVDK